MFGISSLSKVNLNLRQSADFEALYVYSVLSRIHLDSDVPTLLKDGFYLKGKKIRSLLELFLYRKSYM